MMRMESAVLDQNNPKGKLRRRCLRKRSLKIARLKNEQLGDSRYAIVNEERNERSKRTAKEQSRENKTIRTMNLQINSRQEKEEQVAVCCRDSRELLLRSKQTKKQISEEDIPLKRKQRDELCAGRDSDNLVTRSGKTAVFCIPGAAQNSKTKKKLNGSEKYAREK